jgi:hypothetical protein
VGELERAWLKHVRKQLADKRAGEPSRERLEAQTANETRKPKSQTVPSSEKRSAKPSFKEKLPDGPAPIQVVVKMDEDERLLVHRKSNVYQPVTSYVTANKDGEVRPVTSYQLQRIDHAEIYDTDEFRVYDTEGHAVRLKELRKRLKGETLALISANGRPVDPLHLRLYKEDTLIFVLPLRPVPAVPVVGTAPPPAPLDPPVPIAPPSVSPAPPVDDPEASVPPSKP